MNGRVFLTLFLAVFLIVGLFLEWMFLREVIEEMAPYFWTRSEAVILATDMREEQSDTPYEFVVHYRYEFQGREFTGDQFTSGKQRYSDLGEISRLQNRYAVHARTPCWVNPKAPGEAVIERRSPWGTLIVFFPLLFIAIGGGGIYGTWRGKGSVPENAAAKPLSEQAGQRSPVLFLRIFGLVFFLIGCSITYLLLFKPLLLVVKSRNWKATPCKVVSSRVMTHSGDDGNTYSVEVRYAYEVDGRNYQANRYSFATGSTSGYAGKKAVVSRFPPHSDAVCYVNPADPTDAVINRQLSKELWFGLLPLAFVIAGAYILGAAPKRGGGRLAPVVPNLPGGGSMAPPVASDPGYFELKATGSRLGKLIVVILFATFWCGIVSIFVVDVVKGWRRGSPDWFGTLFLIPFVLIGAGALAAIPYQILALLNPRVHLRIHPRAVPLGGGLQLEWSLSGRTRKVRRIKIWLEGREEATYRRGTDTLTDKNIFFSLTLCDSTEPDAIAFGQRVVTIPSDFMHTFIGANNKICWSLRVQGGMPRRPNIDEEFE
ncbi:MAG: DUF3592 domain-containing protein, partial [Verrucomicrobiota bacterium]